MFFVLQFLVKIGTSHSWKPWTNLVPRLSKCVDLVILTKFY